MKQHRWAVWIFASKGRRVRPKDVGRNNTRAGFLLFAAPLPASVAATSTDVLRGVLAARDRTGSYTGDGWQEVADGWDDYRCYPLFPGDVMVVVDPDGRGHMYRLRTANGADPSAWSHRRIRRRWVPNAALLPSSFVGGLLYGQLVSGELVLSAS